MTYLTLPLILVATALFAGALVFMPVDEAQAVHTTIQGTQLNTATVETNCSAGMNADPLTAISDGDFLVHYIFTAVTDAGTITFVDGAAGAANLVLDITIDSTIAGTLAFPGTSAVTFTDSDDNTDGCITIQGESANEASIVIG